MKSIFFSRSYNNKQKGVSNARFGLGAGTGRGTYLFLEAQGNSADGADGDALHQVSGETSDLVAETLGLDNCNVVDDSLVGVEVGGEPASNTPN